MYVERLDGIGWRPRHGVGEVANWGPHGVGFGMAEPRGYVESAAEARATGCDVLGRCPDCGHVDWFAAGADAVHCRSCGANGDPAAWALAFNNSVGNVVLVALAADELAAVRRALGDAIHRWASPSECNRAAALLDRLPK